MTLTIGTVMKVTLPQSGPSAWNQHKVQSSPETIKQHSQCHCSIRKAP